MAVIKHDFGKKKKIMSILTPKSATVRILINLVLTGVIAAVLYYLMLPPINLQATEFYTFIMVIAAVYGLLTFISSGAITKQEFTPYAKKHIKHVSGAIIGVVLVIMLIGGISSAVIFRADDYTKLLNFKTGNFAKDIHEIDFDEVPMLDRDSAIRLGDKKLGELSKMVSQFEVDASYYTQINYKGKPVRVTPLRYGDPIKWFKNHKQGLPAYMIIDMVTQEVTAVQLKDGIKYSSSEIFGHKLKRFMRFNYPTAMFDTPTFEIDDQGNPYWVVPTLEKKIGLFGGRNINGIVLVNAVTGESQSMTINETPQWIDRVFSSDLIVQQYNYHGTYIHGFLNSLLGQKDVTVTTDGYNYIAQDDDVYMYTGVTSVGGDQSNIGFILSNQRTKETKFYPVPGATESSAMESANGQAQNYGYTSTFPLLLNVSGQPTYFMALKDNSNLVKNYAMVNVSQFQLVALGDSTDPQACKEKYIKMLIDKKVGGKITVSQISATGTVTDIRTAVKDGDSYYYIKLNNSPAYYVISAAKAEIAVTLNVGDSITVKYMDESKGKAIINANEIALNTTSSQKS